MSFNARRPRIYSAGEQLVALSLGLSTLAAIAGILRRVLAI